MTQTETWQDKIIKLSEKETFECGNVDHSERPRGCFINEIITLVEAELLKSQALTEQRVREKIEKQIKFFLEKAEEAGDILNKLALKSNALGAKFALSCLSEGKGE